MEQDLRLDVGSRYTTALLVFFIAHIFFGVRLHLCLSRYTHMTDGALAVALKHPSLQNRDCELASLHCFRLGNRDAGPGTNSLHERVASPKTPRYSRIPPQGFVKSYQALAICRAILGFCGAGKTSPSLVTFPDLKVS
jgi:hypothetical protein